jgi:hypothetical protein
MPIPAIHAASMALAGIWQDAEKTLINRLKPVPPIQHVVDKRWHGLQPVNG